MSEAEALSKYKSMVKDTLQPLEKRHREDLARAKAELQEWSSLVEQLRSFSAHVASSGTADSAAKPPIEMLADIGEGFHMHAHVTAEDAEMHVAVAVGAGVFVELPLSEAITHATGKVAAAKRAVETAQEKLMAVLTDLTVARTALLALDER